MTAPSPDEVVAQAPPQIADRLATFRAALRGRTALSVVRRFVTFGDCYLLDEDRHFDLRAEVADHFDVHPNDVFVVGSGKLGFSIAPMKRYRAFGDTSDLDIAVLSTQVFDRIWTELYEYDRSAGFWPQKASFQKYLFRGWIRPDLLPPAPVFRTADAWTEFFKNLSASGRYGLLKISAGVYRNGYFFEQYQLKAVEACQSALEES